jgi:hypothetical protein
MAYPLGWIGGLGLPLLGEAQSPGLHRAVTDEHGVPIADSAVKAYAGLVTERRTRRDATGKIGSAC